MLTVKSCLIAEASQVVLMTQRHAHGSRPLLLPDQCRGLAICGIVQPNPPVVGSVRDRFVVLFRELNCPIYV